MRVCGINVADGMFEWDGVYAGRVRAMVCVCTTMCEGARKCVCV